MAKPREETNEMPVMCPECGAVNVEAGWDGFVEYYPRAYHAECAERATRDGRDPREA